MDRNQIQKNLWRLVTQLGSPFFYLLIVLFFWKTHQPFAFGIIVLMAITELFCWSIKFFYKKERPIAKPRTNFFSNIDANSFPSIHVARISALFAYSSFFYQNAAFFIAGTGAIFLVAYSRIYLKKHYLVDTVFGFIIGIVLSFVFVNAL